MTAGDEPDRDGGPAGRPRRRRVLYGRSRGKALREGHERLIAEALPRLSVEPGALAAPGLFAPEPRELWLEIGFGSGEHMIAEAAANPDVGFIGCEPFLNGVAAALVGIARSGIHNVRIRRGDVQSLIDAAPAGTFSRVYVLYPDPWPKRRHNKRRLISEATVEALARVLRPRGEVRFATDSDDYAGWTLSRFLASPHFCWTAIRADDWRLPWSGWRPTRYEAKARREGRKSAYLSFRRL